MILVRLKKVLPDCVDYLRPYQLIKFNLHLFVYFLGCDSYQQLFTSTHPLYLRILFILFTKFLFDSVLFYKIKHFS